MPIEIFRSADDAPAPPGNLEFFTSKDVVSPFGYKAEEIDGTWFWVPGTEEEYRVSEAERLEIDPKEVQVRFTCYQTGPHSCAGVCGGTSFCRLIFNPAKNYYYCGCT